VTRRGWPLAGPGVAWLLVFFALPLAFVAGFSLMPRGPYGGVEPGLTLEAYRRFLVPIYLSALARTALFALACTVLCLVLGFPVAYAISRSRRWKTFLLVLVVLPLWTSFLVRTFAIIFLIRDTGLVNQWLLAAGIVREPLTLLYTPGAVVAGLVYGFLPFMILPIYASLEKLDLALLEAAEALGAGPAARLRRVVLPLAMPGIVAGALLVFVPALGAFLTPDLLGGAKQLMIGNLIQNQFAAARNWPFGSAASLVMCTLVLAAVLVWLRLRDRAEEAA
jgi:spermidine/putrescine transport system permease protein